MTEKRDICDAANDDIIDLSKLFLSWDERWVGQSEISYTRERAENWKKYYVFNSGFMKLSWHVHDCRGV